MMKGKKGKKMSKQKEYVRQFIELVQNTGDVPIIPMVDSEIVADDSYGRWTGSFGDSRLTWYYMGHERIHFNDYTEYDEEEIINDLSREDEKRLIPADCTDVYDLSEEQWKEIIGELEWKLAIVVNIDTPDGDL